MAGSSNVSAFEKIVNIIVSIGAAVVIFGAWAKILHKSFADFMLTLGLLTEAAIFLLYAYLELKKGAVEHEGAVLGATYVPSFGLGKLGVEAYLENNFDGDFGYVDSVVGVTLSF